MLSYKLSQVLVSPDMNKEIIKFVFLLSQLKYKFLDASQPGYYTLTKVLRDLSSCISDTAPFGIPSMTFTNRICLLTQIYVSLKEFKTQKFEWKQLACPLSSYFLGIQSSFIYTGLTGGP